MIPSRAVIGVDKMNLDTYWPEILDVVRKQVPQQTFNTWFLPLQPSSLSAENPEVFCPNHFFLDWFSEHHLTTLNEAGSTYFNKEVQFGLLVQESANRDKLKIFTSLPLDREEEDAHEAASSLKPASTSARRATKG